MGSATHIGSVEPNPAMQTNRCATILVTGAVLQSSQDLDPNEEIEICLLPLAEVSQKIRQGEITNAMVVAAFHYFNLYHSQ